MPHRAIAVFACTMWAWSGDPCHAGAGPQPSITQQPAGATVTDGNSVRLSITAAGVPPLTYQWMAGPNPVAGATASVLSIPKAIYSYHNGRGYAAVVTDGNGAKVTSATAVLTVLPNQPVITESPLSETVDAGSNAAFAVAAHGTLPLSYQWSRNGAAVPGATSPQYATGAVSYANNGRDWYTVTVTNGAGQSVTSAAAVLSVSQWATDARIGVDISEADDAVAHQVTYRRGEVVAFDAGGPDASPSAIVGRINGDVRSAGINLVTATLDINGRSDQGFFDYNPASPQPLTPDPAGSGALTQTFSALRGAMGAAQLPVVVQVSGTPYVFSGKLDPNYEVVCGAAGNFYPLPLTGAPSQQAQGAIGDWIVGVSASIPDAIWIGTQEPTHTLGYPAQFDPSHQGCSSPNSSQTRAAQITNIDRFAAFWGPIAHQLSSRSIRSGGIQPNASDSQEYVQAANQIISALTPLDYFTIQNYNPSLSVAQSAYSAYQVFQSRPEYLGTKLIMDRYGISLSGYDYNSAGGMVQYLQSESQLMPYADMLYGYSVETSGMRESGTLLPPLLAWLQNAPAPLRPLTTSNSDVQAFALVQKSGSTAGRIAIWNGSPSSTTRSVSLALNGYPKPLSPSGVTVLKGSGQAMAPYNTSGLSISGQSISGLSLAPNEFLLISVR